MSTNTYLSPLVLKCITSGISRLVHYSTKADFLVFIFINWWKSISIQWIAPLAINTNATSHIISFAEFCILSFAFCHSPPQEGCPKGGVVLRYFAFCIFPFAVCIFHFPNFLLISGEKKEKPKELVLTFSQLLRILPVTSEKTLSHHRNQEAISQTLSSPLHLFPPQV